MMELARLAQGLEVLGSGLDDLVLAPVEDALDKVTVAVAPVSVCTRSPGPFGR